MAAKSLQEFSESRVISDLSKLASRIESCFSCGGIVPEVKSSSVVFKKKTGEWSPKALHLPTDLTSDGEKLQTFLEACSTATFGIGGETVTDREYRDALKLDPESFHTDFLLANTTIIGNIASIMSVGSSVRAELYKLNVYSTSGHFKAHVDTPRSKTMFGSLVVCLPSQFTGGALFTRHQGRQVMFDWASSPATTQWAAFYSDVEHEVLPVTSGHRITLTYNLYHSVPFHKPSFDVTASPLYRELLAALQTPHFMRNGGVLGFFCQHKYVECTSSSSAYDLLYDLCEKGLSTKNGDLPFLKGEDMIVYQVAESLGLSIQLKPICEYDKTLYVLPSFRHQRTNYELEDTDERIKILKDNFGGLVQDTEHVHWCVEANKMKEPILSGVYYGNMASSFVCYQAAALLLEVPEFTSERGLVTTNLADPSAKNVIKC